ASEGATQRGRLCGQPPPRPPPLALVLLAVRLEVALGVAQLETPEEADEVPSPSLERHPRMVWDVVVNTALGVRRSRRSATRRAPAGQRSEPAVATQVR